MARDDKTCVICGKKYKYCENCPSKYNTSETWRNIFCSENCRGLYHIYNDIKAGKITDKSAQRKMNKFDISDLKSFNEPMRSVLLIASNSDRNEKENNDEVKKTRKKINNFEVDSKKG